MFKVKKEILIILIAISFEGCVIKVPQKVSSRPIYQPPSRVHSSQPTMITSEYGLPPKNYKKIIQNYFANKLKRPKMASFKFSKPQKAYKRKGLAYGGDIAWRGWLVDVLVSQKSRSGRLQSAKPHMILFSNSVIVDDILGNNHQLITRVGE